MPKRIVTYQNLFKLCLLQADALSFPSWHFDPNIFVFTRSSWKCMSRLEKHWKSFLGVYF